MSSHAADEMNQKVDDNALKEYKLAVQTQMHFNEILMKFRAFGIAVVTCFLYIYIPCLERMGGDKLFSGFDLVAH